MAKAPAKTLTNAKAVQAAKAIDGKQTEFRIEGAPGLVLVVQPSGTGTWSYQYRVTVGVTRKKRSVALGSRDTVTLAEARERAIDLRREVEAGGDPAGDKVARREAITFRALAEMFIERRGLKPKVVRFYLNSLATHILPVIGDIPADEVTPDDLHEMLARMDRENAKKVKEAKAIQDRMVALGDAYNGPKPPRVSVSKVPGDRCLQIVGGAYRWGLEQNLVTTNPRERVKNRIKGKEARARERTRRIEDHEIAAVWATLDNPEFRVSSKVARAIKLLILTGQRRDEIVGATRDELHDLDGDNPRLIIRGAFSKGGQFVRSRMKEDVTQVTPLSPQAAELFREALEEGEGNRGEVFPADMSRVKTGSEPRVPHIHGDSVSHKLPQIREFAGLDQDDVEHFVLHDARRSVSSWLKENGFDRDVRDAVLAHKDTSVTGARYEGGANIEGRVRKALQAWADHVWQVTGQAAGGSSVVQMRKTG